MSTTIDQLETPEVLVDRARLIANIERVQAIATRHGLALRPHAKTHKCIEIARLQLQRGAVALTASKPDEAIVFIQSGVTRSITGAYPIVDVRKLDRLIRASEKNDVELRIVVDSLCGIDAARQCGAALRVFVKMDVGLHRCGVGAGAVLALADEIRKTGNLELVGLLSHAGHAYAAESSASIARIAEEERVALLSARDELRAAGCEIAEISVGSTPTVLTCRNFDGVTEIRPGNYVFLDATAVRLGLATFDDIALSVLTTVISANDRYFIIDAGSKVLSSDSGAHGTGGGAYGLAFPLVGSETQLDGFKPSSCSGALRVVRLSEEHGFVERAGRDVALGTKLRVVPNHACPVANLAERLTIVSADKVIDQWPVAARGKVR